MAVTTPEPSDTGRFDISRTAIDLIRAHLQDAPLVAARWSRCAAHAGDLQRSAAWRQVVEALDRAQEVSA